MKYKYCVKGHSASFSVIDQWQLVFGSYVEVHSKVLQNWYAVTSWYYTILIDLCCSYTESPPLKIRNKTNIEQITAVILALWQLLFVLNKVNNSHWYYYSRSIISERSIVQTEKSTNVRGRHRKGHMEWGKTCYFSLLTKQSIKQRK